ncbi:hypothetical protein [Mobilicoccus pelagius]|uniref:Uncharacterized protein n=1 Tax=Mobilicoccus pelagius NBRC 104925 TaxID=1089455 RepID=H5UNA1_9MICO|nr:hypothetical protein [Mobilicoccus pelagius]GAB47209.1 hypothetical protein MOPEL_007_00260 [Mobilicoccus pelagius NBRC 104925]
MEITVEFTTDEFETITAAAERHGMSVEDFTRSPWFRLHALMSA